LQDKVIPDYVTVLRIHGPFMFGTTDLLAEETADLSRYAPVVILRLRNMTAIDATGLHALEAFCDRLKRSGRPLILCGARRQPAKFLARGEFIEHIGRDNIQPHIDGALSRAVEIHGSEVIRSATPDAGRS
jgi:SulP family sulfate permease